MNFQFQYPEAFWLLVLVPVLALFYFLYLQWRKRAARQLGDPALVAELTRNHSSKKALLKFSLFTLAFALGCFTLANPRKPDDASAEVRKGIDAVIALDVSNSMLATDVQPTRLQKAQSLLTSLINKMPNDRIGLVVFAGNAYTQMPLSTDHEAAKLFVTTANPTMVPEQGTAIADALLQSNAAFEEGSQRFKTIILVTDGETHDEDALPTVQGLAKKGVMVNTVGLGSPEGSVILDSATGQPRTDENGQPVVSRLNEELLQGLAQATNGTYIHLNDIPSSLAMLQDQYKNVEKKALVDTSALSYESFYWWFLLPVFLILLAEVFLPDRKKLTK
ncbi:MAG: VWA domain-containing protein [Bacteroidota bacterium]|nr:VWA domain-containing protein [Bacteroidota bacterium]